MALIAENFKEKEKRAEALGVWTSIIAGSVVIGPLLGGPISMPFDFKGATTFALMLVGILLVLESQSFYFKTKHLPGNP